jgi:hypothetical protein
MIGNYKLSTDGKRSRITRMRRSESNSSGFCLRYLTVDSLSAFRKYYFFEKKQIERGVVVDENKETNYDTSLDVCVW